MSDFYFEVLVRNTDGVVFHRAVYDIEMGGETDFALGDPIVLDNGTVMFGYKIEANISNKWKGS